MMPVQMGIIEPQSFVAMYQFWDLHQYQSPQHVRRVLERLSEMCDGGQMVLAIGPTIFCLFPKASISLPAFPVFHVPPASIPSIPIGLMLWIRGQDRGHVLHQALAVQKVLEPCFKLIDAVDAFKYKTGFDLSNYEDGTENPTGEEALAAAFVTSDDENIHGSSIVAVQQWLHSFDKLNQYSQHQQNHMIGREQSTNMELEDAPPSAHVKRTAQESFDPEAFVLRRSMPWSKGMESGLMFVAFGRSHEAFEAQLRRMVGLDDGIVDALFHFSYPFTGCYYWCPPVRERRVNLQALFVGLDQ